jgi:hypothetical protein
LLSSVDPVLYCDINGPTHAPTVLSLARSATSVFDSSLGSLRIVRLCAHTAAALLFASSIVLYSVLCLTNSGKQYN